MMYFETKRLPVNQDAVAPDGSDVRILLKISERGSMAHFELPPGEISTAVIPPDCGGDLVLPEGARRDVAQARENAKR